MTRKLPAYITEILLKGCKINKQTNKIIIFVFQPLLEKVNRSMREIQQKLGHINMEGENLRGKIEGRKRNMGGMNN